MIDHVFAADIGPTAGISFHVGHSSEDPNIRSAEDRRLFPRFAVSAFILASAAPFIGIYVYQASCKDLYGVGIKVTLQMIQISIDGPVVRSLALRLYLGFRHLGRRRRHGSSR
jgi:hypothetical protein